MTLSEDQKKTVARKFEEGASLADIQRLVNDEFGIHMTYMEARFLIDDLNLEFKKPEPPEEEATEDPKPAEAATDLLGSVSVEMDKIKRPGAAISGSVTFSDGVGAKWYVDPHGRLGLDPDQEGYQPSAEDLQEFQTELQRQIQGPGL